eukprot:411229_1
MIYRLRNAFTGQTFESPQIYDNIWCLGIEPKSHKNHINANDVIIYLQICSLPIDTNKVTVKSEMKCMELNIQADVVTRAYNVNDRKFPNIPYRIGSTQHFFNNIKMNNIKQLTICFQISINQHISLGKLQDL